MNVKKHSISFTPQLTTELTARGEKRSTVLGECLERYFAALAESRRRLLTQITPAEMSLICDILNGSLQDARSARYLADEITDSAPDGMGEKWGVDINALAAEVAALSYVEKLALIDAAERYWERVSNGEQPDPGQALK